MMCSKESAYILLEVCNNSLEDSEKRLTLFFHLDSFLEESNFIKQLKNIFQINLIKNFLDELEKNNLGNLFEAVSNFLSIMTFIKSNT